MCLLYEASFFAVRTERGWLITECLGLVGSHNAWSILLRGSPIYGRQFEISSNELCDFIEEGNALQFGHGKIQHFAISIGKRYTGGHCIIHDPGVKYGSSAGIQMKLLDEELKSTNEFVIFKCKSGINSPLCRYLAVQRATSALGVKDYSILFKNCEHLAQFCCQIGVNRSSQVVTFWLLALRTLFGLGMPVAIAAFAIKQPLSVRTTLGMCSLALCSGYGLSKLVIEPSFLKIYRANQDSQNAKQKTKHIIHHLNKLNDVKQRKTCLNTATYADLTELKCCLLNVLAFFQQDKSKNFTFECALSDCRELMLQYIIHRYRLQSISKSFRGSVNETQLNGLKCIKKFLSEKDIVLCPTPAFYSPVMNAIENLVKNMRTAISKGFTSSANFRFTMLCQEIVDWFETVTSVEGVCPLRQRAALVAYVERNRQSLQGIEQVYKPLDVNMDEEEEENEEEDPGENIEETFAQFTITDLFLQSERKTTGLLQLYRLD